MHVKRQTIKNRQIGEDIKMYSLKRTDERADLYHLEKKVNFQQEQI